MRLRRLNVRNVINQTEELVDLFLGRRLTMVPHAFHIEDQFVTLLCHPTLIATGYLFMDHHTFRVITPCAKYLYLKKTICL